MTHAQGGILTGLERALVFNRLRAAVGVRWELPWLLAGITLPADGRCLEIGSGYGWGTLGLARRHPSLQIVATDYDGRILPMTRAHLQQQRVGSRVAFCQANAKQLPFPTGCFDAVLALYVFHHVWGYRPALQEIARVLRPGGRLLFIDVVRPPGLPPLRRLVPPAGLPSRRALRRLLEAVGFQVERERGLPFWVGVVACKIPP